MKTFLAARFGFCVMLMAGLGACSSSNGPTDLISDLPDSSEWDNRADIPADLPPDLASDLVPDMADLPDMIAPVPVSNNSVIINALAVGGGFSFSGGAEIENALGGMVAEAALLNGVASAMIQSGEVMLLLEFQGLDSLPAPGQTTTVDVVGLLGADLNPDKNDNFDFGSFYAALASFDPYGNAYIRFQDVQLATDARGVTTFSFGADPYQFSFFRTYTGLEYDVEIRFLKFAGELAVDALGHLVLVSATCGGVLPDFMLNQFGQMAIDISGMAVDITAFQAAEDIILGTGTTPNALSLGFELTAVPALLKSVSPVLVTNDVVILSHFTISGGADFDGDELVDNALDTLSVAAMLEAAVQGMLESGTENMLLRLNLSQLPPMGGSVTTDIEGIVGLDLDSDLTDNFDLESFGVGPAGLDPEGRPYVVFRNAQISTNRLGGTQLYFAADPFQFSFRRAGSDQEYVIEIRNLRLGGTLSVDLDGNLLLTDGTLVGVMSDLMLQQFGQMALEITGLSIDTSSFQSAEDIDLSGNLVPDALSMGFTLDTVPALIP